MQIVCLGDNLHEVLEIREKNITNFLSTQVAHRVDLTKLWYTGFIMEYMYYMNLRSAIHYVNMPIQIYWKFYYQKMKNFR